MGESSGRARRGQNISLGSARHHGHAGDAIGYGARPLHDAPRHERPHEPAGLGRSHAASGHGHPHETQHPGHAHETPSRGHAHGPAGHGRTHEAPGHERSPRANNRHHRGAVLGLALAALAVAIVGFATCGGKDAQVGDTNDGTSATAIKSLGEVTGSKSNPFYAAELILPEKLAPIVGDPVKVDGATATLGQLSPLTNAVRTIEADGHEVGFVMLDVSTGVTVSYHPDRSFFSASSIKGPYVTSVVRYVLGDAAQGDGRIDNILRYSDNDSYVSLRNQYGDDPMRTLVEASGAEQLPSTGITDEVEAAAIPQSADSIADNNYEFVTPNQMVALWGQCREFLTSGEPGADWLAGEFETPEVSSLVHLGGAYGTTWGKAGWYPDEAPGYATTVDAGVVRTASGDVIIAVMTTAPEDFSATGSIITPLLQLHEELS